MNDTSCVIGWDIGGAHLKAAMLDRSHGLRGLHIQACPLWQGIDHLERAFAAALAALPASRCRHVVTMTGEGCDLFAERSEGVRRILECASGMLGPPAPRVYSADAGLVTAAAAHEIASMNWHAMGRALATVLPDALLIDIGSTTTDVILLQEGRVRTVGRDDRERLARDELIYQGVVRTPLMALALRVPYRGAWQGMAAEYFATAADVYRILGLLPDDADQWPSADGRPKTVEHSLARLARMVGDDASPAAAGALTALARWLHEAQVARLRAAVARVGGTARVPMIVGAGVGRFLVRELAGLLEAPYIDYAQALSVSDAVAANDCAPALALAVLGLEA